MSATRPSAPLLVRLRPDLVATPIDAPRGRSWHVKDPIALQFYQFDAREFALLQRLDGRVTIEQLLTEYNRQFAPQHLTARQLLFFIDEARRNGLLLLERPGSQPEENRPLHRTAMQWLSRLNPLAIRLPGLDPDRWLDALYPLVGWAFSRAALAIAGLFVLAALGLVVLRWDEFLDRLPERSAFFTPQTVLWLAAALAVTKVLHELAHAFACKHLGGECHELGVMLLVFVPCLYCNVSDAWLLARRRERMLITAAGIGMELVLAAGATFVWWLAVEGPVRMGALSVMIVTSVSTLLLNGNPLMRYDGYYLFSDLVRVPNLSTEAARVMNELWQQWGLGLSPALPPRADQPRALLATYAASSFLYRLLMFGAILLGVHALARGYRLQVLAWIVTLVSLTSLVAPLVITAAQPLLRRHERRRLSPAHVLTTLAILAGAGALLVLVPVPLHLYAPCLIEASAAEQVVVTVPGLLRESLPAGTPVRAGEVVGRLDNPDLERQRASLEARRDLLRRQLEGYLSIRGASEESAVRIPATREAIADLDQQLTVVHEQLQRLELRASRAGTVLSPPNVPALPVEREVLPTWTGSPLEALNQGCYLEPGTTLCLIGSPDDVTATVIVPQADLPRVRLEQRVAVLLSGLSDRTLAGVVTEVSPVPMETLPREIAARGLVPTDPQSRPAPRPLEPVYQVRVRLTEPSAAPPVLRATGEARIRLASEPFGYRVWRAIQRTFHFEL